MSEIAWDFPDPHIKKVRVQASDIDLMRHTNNVVYLRWLEDVAWDHSRQLGVDEADYERLGHGLVVRRHELDYLLPALLDEEIWLATWILRSDRLSIRRGYQFLRPANGQTVFRGRSLFVCVDIEKGRVRRMPPEFEVAYRSPLQIEEP